MHSTVIWYLYLQESITELALVYRNTDEVLTSVKSWPPADVVFNNVTISPKEGLQRELTKYRERVLHQSVTAKNSINFYSLLTTYLNQYVSSSIVVPERGNIWSMSVAFTTLSRAQDATGLRRAVGSSKYFIIRPKITL